MPTRLTLKSLATGKVTLVAMSIALAFVLTLLLDRCLGLLIDVPVNLIFPSHSVANYSTPEFHIQGRINNLGFRGSDVQIRTRKKARIIALGDSFTFGWGLELQDTWPKVLEEELQKRGLDVEVLNLGRPGADPSDYAEIADKAIPLLKPDLVLVAVNHGDDLGQIMRASMTAVGPEHEKSIWRAAKRSIKTLYPNLVGLSRAALGSPATEVEATQSWKGEVAELLSKLSPDARAKFDQLDDEVKARFVKGELNARILADSLEHPDEMRRTLDLNDRGVRDGIEEISKDLLRIKSKATATHGKVVVISLPNGFFVSHEMQQTYKRLGFVVDPSDLTTTSMDEAIRLSASKAGVDFFEVTAEFRKEAMHRRLFYVFDGHYNADGARFFGSSIADFVSRELSPQER